MSTETKLEAKPRKTLGSAECRRLRLTGQVPANIYGHQRDPVPVSVSEEAIAAIIQTGHKVVDIAVDGESETVMFREVQWNPFGTQIQHVDLLRVDPDERVEVEVGIELKGISPGLQAGGVLDMHMRSLSMECPVIRIPDHIIVSINHLEIGGSVHVRDLVVPEGAKVLDGPDELVLQIVQAKEVEIGEAVPAEGAATEPELVAKERKAAEDAAD